MTRSQSISFFRIYAQYENVGDALIIRELIRYAAYRSFVVIDPSDSPDFFINDLTFGLSSDAYTVTRSNGLLSIFKLAITGRRNKKTTRFFFLPSGIFGEKSRKFYVRVSLEMQAYKLLQSLGVRFFQFGPSYGNLGPLHKKLIRNRVDLLEQHRVRDEISAKYLVSNDIRCDGLIPDLSFGLYREPLGRAEHRGVIAFSFRTDRGHNDAERIEACIESIVQQHDSSTPLRFVSQVRRDDPFMTRLYEKYRTSREAEIVLSDSIPGAINSYGGVEYLYSNRLHSLLIGAYAGVVPVAIVEPQKDIKIIAIFEEFGLESNVITDVSGYDPAKLSKWDLGKSARLQDKLQEVIGTAFA